MPDDPTQAQLNKNTQAIAELATANAVIARDIGYMRNELEKLVKKLDEISDRFATKEDLQHLEEKVNNLESLKDWVLRIVVGAVITAVLAYIGLRG